MNWLDFQGSLVGFGILAAKKLVKITKNDGFLTIKSKLLNQIALNSRKLLHMGWARTDKIFREVWSFLAP